MASNGDVYDYDALQAEIAAGPRVTSLAAYFEGLASGRTQAPHEPVLAQREFLALDSEYEAFHRVWQRNAGPFYKHYCASIPFMLEQLVRLDVAIIRLAALRSRSVDAPLAYWEPNAGEGTTGRALAESSNGVIRTLADTVTVAGIETFRQLCQSAYSTIHEGPWSDVTPLFLSSQRAPSWASSGFDVIHAQCTFQLHGPNRAGQLAYIKRVLKSDGLLVVTEKLRHADPDEFARRERIKDEGFKRRFLSEQAIGEKRAQILGEMMTGMVTLDEFVASAKLHFKHVRMIWNSGNFYEYVLSDELASLDAFVSLLCPPFVPEPFLFEPRDSFDPHRQAAQTQCDSTTTI